MAVRISVVLAIASACVASLADGSVTEFKWHLQRTLSGEGSTALDCQRAIAEFLKKTVALPGGTLVNGEAVAAKQGGMPVSQGKLDSTVSHAESFTISMAGTGSVKVLVPAPGEGSSVSLYLRVEPDLYIRVPGLSRPVAGHFLFDADYPGEYVVAHEPETPAPEPSIVGDFFDFTPVSSAPEAKQAWTFSPIAPEAIAGPVPLVLIHGMVSDRWTDFAHWAEHSDEAAQLREHFQLWNFSHPGTGVTAPIGFSSAYPSFSESVVAYLARFIADAERDGVDVDGTQYLFPSGPYAILTHSTGGLKARAFLVNYPEHAERVFTVITLGCPHMGTPWATPEWARHTLSRIGLTQEFIGEKILQGLLAELVLNGYFNTQRQGDLDTGWANFDAASGFGIPTRKFISWYWPWELRQITVSPRDANHTFARELPGIEDDTFEPPELFDTYCGGLDLITPGERGGMHLDKFFVYASYIDIADDITRALNGVSPDDYESRDTLNGGLRLVQALMAVVESEQASYPHGAYRVGDGFVPVQSQLLLDGTEGMLLYETRAIGAWTVPAMPTQLRESVIHAHTLALPERLRILKGWSHLDTITGRYEVESRHSEFFQRVLEDLLSVLPADAK